MARKGHAKFKKKLNSGLKNNIKDLVDFHVSSLKTENVHFHGLLLFKVHNVQAKNYRDVMCYDTEW